MSIPRIYADFNGLQGSLRNPSRLAVPLDTYGTLRDLSNAGICLRDGLVLTIYDYSDDEEDLEGHASIYWERISGVWLAELDDQGVLYVPKKERIQSDEFLCVSCRTPLEDFVRENGLCEDTSCPVCAEPTTAPIAPPR